MEAGLAAGGGRNSASRGRLGVASGPGGSVETGDLGGACLRRARGAVGQVPVREVVEVLSARCLAKGIAGPGRTGTGGVNSSVVVRVRFGSPEVIVGRTWEATCSVARTRAKAVRTEVCAPRTGSPVGGDAR